MSETTLQANLVKLVGICRLVHTERLPSCLNLFTIARAHSHDQGCVFLASGGEVDSATYHILALKPWFILHSKGKTWTCQQGAQRVCGTGSPLSVLRWLLIHNHIPPTGHGPVQAGLFGYLGYELHQHIENIPNTCLNDTGLPDVYFSAPTILIIQECTTGQTWMHLPVWDHPQAPTLQKRRDMCQQWIQECSNAHSIEQTSWTGPPCSSLTHAQYIRAVHRILEYIRIGHVYQVNLSQRLVHPFQGHTFDLFSNLFAKNPAPFYAYIQTGEHQVVSTSPERFLKVDNEWVETRPIKGTRPRGETPEQDLSMARELQESAKDGAELAMIVDLMRNDLGRVCTPGSVQVTEHKRLEAYDNVFHLVSIVQGRLEPERDLVDLIQAAFPGGSITGCPKIRAMEIIDELEPFQRHVYTGSIGYLGFDGRMDLSIAIRTAEIGNGRLVYSVGGGIVIDSDPEEEYQETWHKGRSFAQVLTAVSQANSKKTWVWHNGQLVPESEARCSMRAPAVEYGYGVFETLRTDCGRIWFSSEHIARLKKAWRELTGKNLPNLDWEKIIRRVLEANQLDATAAVKLYTGQGLYGDIFCVSARAYTHRLAGQKRSNLDLITYPEPRQSPLAKMKTSNHMVYILAGEWARKQGADEALILNPDGTISETNSANLILIHGYLTVVPRSPHVLPGIMQAKALSALSTLGFEIVNRLVYPDELFTAEAVLLTNSLLGVIGSSLVDGQMISQRKDLVRQLNNLIFGFQPLSEPDKNPY